MKGIPFKESNAFAGKRIFSGSGLDPLPVYTDGQTCVSVWNLTQEDIDRMIKERKFYLMVRIPPDFHPPVHISSENLIPDNPFIKP